MQICAELLGARVELVFLVSDGDSRMTPGGSPKGNMPRKFLNQPSRPIPGCEQMFPESKMSKGGGKLA